MFLASIRSRPRPSGEQTSRASSNFTLAGLLPVSSRDPEFLIEVEVEGTSVDKGRKPITFHIREDVRVTDAPFAFITNGHFGNDRYIWRDVKHSDVLRPKSVRNWNRLYIADPQNVQSNVFQVNFYKVKNHQWGGTREPTGTVVQRSGTVSTSKAIHRPAMIHHPLPPPSPPAYSPVMQL